jgi:hypothetical protein
MKPTLSISKKTINFILEKDINKGYEQIQIQNLSNHTRLGFKIRSTNISRYLVNPTSAIIEPSESINIDILLTIKENDDLNSIIDKFCVYSLEIKDEDINMANVEKYIKQNSNELKKNYLKVTISRKSDSKEPSILKGSRNSVIGESGFKINTPSKVTVGNNEKEDFEKNSIFRSQNEKSNYISLINETGGSLDTSLKTSNDNFVNNIKKSDNLKLEEQLILKDNQIMKLMNEKKILEKDLNLVKEKIINKNNGSFIEKSKTAFSQILLFLLIGFIFGVLFNSAH